jgi:ATP-binding cassette subfamily B protein
MILLPSSVPRREQAAEASRYQARLGGQCQGIVIGRALLKTAPIIIVDEAPSSLDIDSEIAVHRSLLCLMRDRTVIAVAHRLSTMAAFDCILVMEGGTIVQEGTPKACRRLRSS